MNSPRVRRNCAAALALFVTLATGANATVEKDFPGGPRLIIPAAAFNNTGLSPNDSTFNTTGFLAGGSDLTCFVAPAYLPDGVRVTRLFASLVDMSSSDMQVSLVRTANEDYRSSLFMASVISNGNTDPIPLPNSYGTSDIIEPIVRSPEYSYSVFACLRDFRFRLIQVELRYAGDLLFRNGFEATGRGGGAKSTPFGSPLSIAAAEFKPDGFQAGELFVSFVDGALYGANYAATRFAHAPIYLPDGARITEVRARYQDNDAGGGGAGNCAAGTASDVELFIVRNRGCLVASCWDNMVQLSSSGATSGLRTLTSDSIAFPVIDGDEYGYFALFRLCGPKHKLYNLRIYYDLP